jgi:hypothetical protein
VKKIHEDELKKIKYSIIKLKNKTILFLIFEICDLSHETKTNLIEGQVFYKKTNVERRNQKIKKAK